ncbi:hypothetical protein T01_1650 [Trichinella spiralis]|uniref:Uncharacterized protein n=1 Tax=Trichinella spiralis TaxID=6334 RepID=A0A0V1AUR2_TRISP|nr:hypothetical protein T01_1650 [Trichinella spiralis]
MKIISLQLAVKAHVRIPLLDNVAWKRLRVRISLVGFCTLTKCGNKDESKDALCPSVTQQSTSRFISLDSGNVRLFVFHWWLMWPFVHSYNARRCSQRGMLAEFLTCGGVFCLSEFFVMAFSARVMSENKRSETRIWKRPHVRIPLVVDVVVCALLQSEANKSAIQQNRDMKPFNIFELLLLFLLCIRCESSDQSVSIVLSFKDDRNIVTKRPAALKLPSA